MTSEWIDVELGNLIAIKHGFAFKGQHFVDEPTAHQLVTPGNFAIGGGFQVGKAKYYSGPVPVEYVLRHGNLVVTMTDLSRNADTLGYSALIPETLGTIWLHNQRIGLVELRDSAKACPEFLYFLMRTADYRHWVVAGATGSTVRHTSPSRICSYRFRLPPLRLQRDIADVLSSLEDRIALLRETNASLEAIAQALFKSWFVDFDPVRAKSQGLAPAGMDEATAALFPDGFEASALGPVPKGWSVGTLEDLLVLQRGFDLPAQDRRPGSFPIIAASGPSGTHDEAMAKGPGVVTGRSGVLGRVFLELGDYWPLNTTLWVKEFRRASPCFAYETLRRLDFKAFNAGSAVPTLNRNHIHGLPYVLPPKRCVEAYEDVALALHQRRSAMEQQAQSLAELRDTLLPRLIAGQLRLPEAALTDDPAPTH